MTDAQYAVRCYICGKPIAERFVLFTLSPNSDRVFIVHHECTDRLGDDPIQIPVIRAGKEG